MLAILENQQFRVPHDGLYSSGPAPAGRPPSAQAAGLLQTAHLLAL